MEPSERQLFQAQSLKWLYELELLNNPNLINNLKFNILSVSSHIKEVEILLSKDHKQILIYIELSWFSKKFRYSKIEYGILSIIQSLLPSYRCRVVHDREILNKALKLLETYLIGDLNEIPSTSNDDGNDVASGS